MHRLFLGLAVVTCLTLPANLYAQDAGTFIERGEAWRKQGNDDQAIANYDQALRVAAPNDTYNMTAAHYDRGLAWNEKGEYDKAVTDFNQAIALSPNAADPYNGRGNAWRHKGEYDKAIADYNHALAVDPNVADFYYNRGLAWNGKGGYDKAIADFNQSLAISPNDADFLFDRGVAWENKGEFDKAIADYNHALAVNPNDVDACNSLAWLYATRPEAKYRDGAKAFENASKAYQLDGGKFWGYLDTLAAAYAENGDFANAQQWEAKAIELATADKDKQKCRSRLELYKQRKPYRQEPKKT
jgi:tetratricopeptide (TPR) repeat protein